jgi:2-hydroxychromene-2-carboxylate isomerase
VAKTLEFWFEFASTYSYVAAERVEDAARAANVELVWRPFLLGPIFAAQGLTDSPFNLFPAKGAYMWRDMERLCARIGAPFRKPSAFPRNGLLAARVATSIEDAPEIGAFARSVYRANFAEDRDIGERAVVAERLEACGLDAAAVLRRAESDGIKMKLRARTEEAASRGLFGAPSFFVGDALFWGGDRLDDAVAAAAGDS